MENFLQRLARNPYAPIDAASVTRVDELGNGYDDWGNIIAPKFEAPEQTWGETALGVATAPARLATALAGSLSPYGQDGWQVPPIVSEGVDALTAVGDAYTGKMAPEEIPGRALGMAGFMFAGGAPALALERSLAQRGINSTADMIPTAVKDYGTAKYLNWRYPDEPAVDPRNAAQWKQWAETDTRARLRNNRADAVNRMNQTIQSDMDGIDAGRPSVFNDFTDDTKLTPQDAGYMNALLQSRKPEFDVIDGGLYANASKDASIPAILAGQEARTPGLRLEYDLDSPFGKTAYAIKDGYTVGEFSFDELPNALMMRDARVDPEFRRQGIASEVYGKLQDEFGLPMTPDITLTPEGYGFWKKNYPGAVKNYTFNGISWRPDGAHADPDLGYQAVADGVPDWRMSGGPNRPEGVLWSNSDNSASVPAIAGALAEERPGITAYHGSPHDFDKFDLSKVGTGQGASTQGRGVNLAANEDLARQYRDKLSEGTGQRGHMYQVRVNAGQDQFLDLDAPLYKQPEPVQEALKTLGAWKEPAQYKVTPSAKGDKWTVRNVWGDAVGTYKTEERALAAAQKGSDRFNKGAGLYAYTRMGGNTVYGDLDGGTAAQKLLDAGVVGTRSYAGKPNETYVVFDDSLIEILKKYGWLAPGAMYGAGALTSTPAEAGTQEQDIPDWLLPYLGR